MQTFVKESRHNSFHDSLGAHLGFKSEHEFATFSNNIELDRDSVNLATSSRELLVDPF
jgi:hypothetical protein